MIISATIADNREVEIADAIRSVVAHVDRVLLVDTGITDRTIELAKEVAGKKLVVIERAWSDFADVRNESLNAAENLGAEWTVVVDSDERLDFGETQLRESLERAKADVLLIESDDGFYPKEKIVRAGCGARYFGPTHEALIGGERELLRGVTFRELPKSEEQLSKKFTRDVTLLNDFLKDHPNDPRWWYYLGMSLEGLGRHGEAAMMFGRCAQLRKVGDEAAWSSFKQAEQLFLLDRFEDAIEAASRGIGANATSAECAWIAAESALKLRRFDQAVAWARIAEAVGRFKGCGPERLWFRYLPALYELPYDVLRWALPDESDRLRAELDFQSAKQARMRSTANVGEDDLDRLSVSRGVSASIRDEARDSLRPPTLRSLCGSARATRIQFDPPGGRLPMNPSICLHEGELWCVVRAVNYKINGRQYEIYDPYQTTRSENYLGVLHLDGRLVDPRLMLDRDPSPRQPSRIVGYEDIRLVSIDGELTGSATVCDRDAERRLIAKLSFDAEGNVERADVQPSNQRHEKNWMPLSVEGEFAWIYSLDPTAILPGPLRECPLKLDHLRGGAAIRLGDGYLCVMHEVIETKEKRIYLHRFARLDDQFYVTAVSPAWVFSHYGIEFCSGLVQHEGQLVLSYGIEDCEAWIMQIDEAEVEAMDWITP